ncbi:hypothetical protein FEM48_Zijuj11G0047300 [Ziziphus jujuba var. spinosa]|uniref:Peptidase S8/S53 domain-containing protein n=1 Tax=Ziziphus jujuba var. spinosa TaxID=714518 RepID=A0A978UGW8_ZIZJJ|nr:hypothetical protein FEM48_Zijuj11G0047300 [Ziziphus jujuba var. spinosa]
MHGRHVVTSLVARLTTEEAKAMKMKDEIVSITSEKMLHLHATYSPSFIGCPRRGHEITSSIATRSFIEDANGISLANRIAASVTPFAHLAIYKVCSDEACPQSIILAAINVVIEDGVDVISMSLNGLPLRSFSDDVFAIFSFQAMRHGNFVSCLARNLEQASGPTMIVMNEELVHNSILTTHVLPAIQVSYYKGFNIKEYMKSTSKPMATIVFEGTKLGECFTPMVLSLSSRGLGLASLEILKLEILGPGVNILTAWPFLVNKSTLYLNTSTSMTCPCISSVTTLLKSLHLDWSQATTKSVIMIMP